MIAPRVLLGDVGGTNTRLELIGPDRGQRHLATFRNSDFASFEDLLVAFLATQGGPVCAQIILAIAAPISGTSIRLTNCQWQIDADRIRTATQAKTVRLINDLEALALSISTLPTSAVRHIFGPAEPAEPLGRTLVLGTGTGFNAACALHPAQLNVLPAECGHMTLPVETEDDLRLRHHLAQGRGRASVERALSGQGLIEIYQWVAQSRGLDPENLTAPQIATQAVQNADPCCVKAAMIVLRILGTVCGDLALAYLPHGGIYLAGSVVRALAPLITTSDFAAELTKKGRQTHLMQSFTVQLITQDSAALIGCARLVQPHPKATAVLIP